MGDSHDEFDAIRSQVELAIMEMENSIQPIYAAAERVKVTFLGMGWTPENAEKAALAWLTGVLSGPVGGVR